ncbi:hypothetical protein [Chondromyces crocatus]|uniref:Uncharacterized protein n=1 Tax=Chondromyces crocatus TaxID=52 RepID=A0A0K1E6L6_CHOCO|nr:hypothetical protein [Chondromyces crocatus]AKT36515.1 uncharacterized protein CMC5_006310 [Chondromyces crocatus]
MHRSPSGSFSTPLPSSFVLGCAGLIAASLLIFGAVGIRALASSEPEAEAVSEPSETPALTTSTTSAPQVAPSPPSERSAVREVRAKLQRDLETGKFPAFVADVEELLQLDPDAGADRKLRSAIIDVLMVITAGRGEHADRLFDLIENRMGTHGIDLLYQLVIAHGGSRASVRAAALLADPAIRARGTPAMRVAYDLRMASCAQKSQHFSRVREDGDTRSLQQLELLKNPCSRRNTCCLHAKDPELLSAIDALRTRAQN